MSHYSCGVHNCKLERDSQSCLPTLSPRAGLIGKLLRVLSKGRLPTHHHRLALRYFKSEKSLINERRRLINATPWFIIHPFSIIAIAREVIMVHVIIADLIVNNILANFAHMPGHNWLFGTLHTVDMICSIIILCNMFASMLIGYTIERTLEVVLKPKRVLLRYLKTYAVLDVWLILSLETPTENIYFNLIFYQLTVVAYCVRFISMISYLRTALRTVYRMPENWHNVTIAIVVMLLSHHYYTCQSAILPRLPTAEGKNVTSIYTKFVLNGKLGLWEQYLVYYHIMLCHFHAAGRGSFGIHSKEESIFYSVVMLASVMIKAYVLVTAWALVRKRRQPEIRYELFLRQLNQYTSRHGLPQRLRYRILFYYRMKYKNKVFSELPFYANLNEHLQHELRLHACKHLFDETPFLKSLPRWVKASIITSLELHTYNVGEIVINADQASGDIYFIARGCLAAYSRSGNEIGHFHDGGVLGFMNYYEEVNEFSAITIEYSELYLLRKEESAKIFSRYPQIKTDIQEFSAARKLRYIHKLGREYLLGIDELLENRKRRYEPNV